MNVIQVENYEDMSQKAAEILIGKIRRFPAMNLGLATGGTPIGTYRRLVQDHQMNGTSYQNITTVNLDEYVGLSEHHPCSYRYYMEAHLFGKVDIDRRNTHLPNGNAEDLKAECDRYEERIREIGGIDVQLLGIGRNGHIGFNEPGTPFDMRTHIANLSLSTRQANARYFSSMDEVPTQAISMGIATILESREILLLASGEDKADALQGLLNGQKRFSLPASALLDHPCVTIVADKEALSKSSLIPS
ncbi:glucosamine-6-phosphate deaminase [Melghirimyces algeriensis]|uniref:Glucosamine-6-phosphate deaminase n=1 Tax=Melghirimyces algeriensis TaxID=910412 RepID=A0A521BYS5_9BACL|nr:glucosamine-6-phosphate deaminase [Melghirimyces algeriensis]SMO52337.1 glucosamine-6-phosphate deaminase [Melghirimyces algeriensis]